VRNGSVSKYYQGMGINIFEGSTQKEEDFVIIREHWRFLLKIRDFLKNHMDQNGPDSFVLKKPESTNPIKAPKRMADNLELSLIVRKRKSPPVNPHIESIVNTLTENTSMDLSEDMKNIGILYSLNALKAK